MNIQEIQKRFAYHRATRETAIVHNEIRQSFTEFAYKINELTPDSREQALVMTALQEAMMWANAAVAMRDMIDNEHPELANDPEI